MNTTAQVGGSKLMVLGTSPIRHDTLEKVTGLAILQE